MDIAIISVVMTSLTACVTVVGSIVSAIITARSNERIRRFELHAPQVYESVKHLADAYSKFLRKEDYFGSNEYRRDILETKALEAYQGFALASYEVMSLIPNNSIHDQLINLLTELNGKHYVETAHDSKFQELILSIAPELLKESGRAKNPRSKPQRKKRK